MLEEMDTKFGGSNHAEKGGELLGIEDAHHAGVDAGVGALPLKQPRVGHHEMAG